MKAAVIAPLGAKKGKSKLTHVHLAGLAMNNYCWQQLRKGIESTRILKNLIVNMVTITREQLAMLAEGMKSNLSIDMIDLSYNKISDSDGDMLARIISNQT